MLDFILHLKSAIDPKRPYVNFAYLNIGGVPARGPEAKGYMKVFDHVLSIEEENQIMLNLKADANFSNPKNATNELLYGEFSYTSAFNKNIGDDEKIDEVKEGKKYLYAFFVGQYTDQSQPKDEKYIIERCAIFYKMFEQSGACHGHNQIYSEKIK